MIAERRFTGSDLAFMRRCVSVARAGSSKGEYPFAAVISRRDEFVCEAHNMVRCVSDVTRHAEIVALSEAQRKLGSTSLEDCTLYSTVEPCAMCSYAIRETRVGRVVFGLRSPLMGGCSRWDILREDRLSATMPEVFAAAPEIQFGCLQDLVQRAFRDRHPFAWHVIKARKIFVADPEHGCIVDAKAEAQPRGSLARWTRSRIIDRLWRTSTGRKQGAARSPV